MAVWGHTGCDAAYRIRLSVCPRCGGKNVMEEIELPKITRFGGHSNAALAASEKSAGFADTTAETVKTAKGKAKVSAPTVLVGESGPELVFPAPVNENKAPFDPANLSVADVLALQADCSDDEWALVLEAERAGKARYGILGR